MLGPPFYTSGRSLKPSSPQFLCLTSTSMMSTMLDLLLVTSAFYSSITEKTEMHTDNGMPEAIRLWSNKKNTCIPVLKNFRIKFGRLRNFWLQRSVVSVCVPISGCLWKSFIHCNDSSIKNRTSNINNYNNSDNNDNSNSNNNNAISGIGQLINCKLQLNTIPSHNVNFSTIRFHKFGVPDRNLLTGRENLNSSLHVLIISILCAACLLTSLVMILLSAGSTDLVLTCLLATREVPWSNLSCRQCPFFTKITAICSTALGTGCTLTACLGRLHLPPSEGRWMSTWSKRYTCFLFQNTMIINCQVKCQHSVGNKTLSVTFRSYRRDLN